MAWGPNCTEKSNDNYPEAMYQNIFMGMDTTITCQLFKDIFWMMFFMLNLKTSNKKERSFCFSSVRPLWFVYRLSVLNVKLANRIQILTYSPLHYRLVGKTRLSSLGFKTVYDHSKFETVKATGKHQLCQEFIAIHWE